MSAEFQAFGRIRYHSALSSCLEGGSRSFWPRIQGRGLRREVMRRFCQILALSVGVLCAALSAHARGLGDMGAAEIKALQQRLADGHCYRGAIDGQASPALQAAINACPSQDPALRIETGMHVAPIKRIGVDRACHIAVTGSVHKTARVGSLPQAR